MMRPRFLLPLLAILAIVTYLPALRQPFIEDDYSNIILARHYGPLSAWPVMFGAPIFRLRATTWLLFYFMNRAFDLHPAGYYCVMIGFHVLDTWLVYALGAWKPIGYRILGIFFRYLRVAIRKRSCGFPVLPSLCSHSSDYCRSSAGFDLSTTAARRGMRPR